MITINVLVAILALILTAAVAAIPALITIGITINKISGVVERLTKLEGIYELTATKFGKRLEDLEFEKKVEERVRHITRGDLPVIEPEESNKREITP